MARTLGRLPGPRFWPRGWATVRCAATVAALACTAAAAEPSLAGCAGRVVVRHVLGSPVCVPSRPQRIVTLDPWLSLGMLQELGEPVVGAPLIGVQEPHVRAALGPEVVDVGHPLQPSLERLVGLKPDLIIGSSYLHGSSYDSLSRIAPTLLIDPIDWKAHFRLMAEVSGHAERADALIGAYEARAAALRSRVPDIRISVVRIGPSGFQVYLQGPAAYGPYAVLQEAGIRRTEYEITSDQTVVKRPDWEEIAALEGDVLLYVVVSGYDTAQDDALEAETLANPLWQMLPAVRAGRAYRVERGHWMGFSGAGSAHKVLDDIERFVLGAP
ncbi:iron-siderophore ABC transporter substrate-binding protein [Ancylobacter sp. FA202]|uniref:iron-siderophore ABC transporter substrate-binding protein n=1 Tax=Ancylobacter sp. FA202 TaxID=1111106 RepID=UPI0003702433|nr:iron-siderophore ABC transporter substrate-binding protein [Ancylobacter sp. FA202]